MLKERTLGTPARLLELESSHRAVASVRLAGKIAMVTEDADSRRAAAIKRAKAKRRFRNHVAIYSIVNAVVVVAWAVSGARYFWPIWPILGWGIGLATHGWSAYFAKPISEEDIRREMDRGD